MRFFMAMLILFLAVEIRGEPKDEKKTVSKKSQNISFDGTDIDGVVRAPDGAYLVEKKGVKFLPLYNVKKQFDGSIKESVDYLR
jgi:hypothetical protein